MSNADIRCIVPDWPAPENVQAAATTRIGGFSEKAYYGLNLGLHVGDDVEHVIKNRQLLSDTLALPNSPCWLQQTHSDIAIELTETDVQRTPNADASFSRQAQQVCAVLTADCLPILLCDTQGETVAAVHAGWRGLQQNIIGKTIAHLGVPPQHLLAWLGPAIGPDAFEVGDDVYQQFYQQHRDNKTAFQSIGSEKWLANLYDLARLQLNRIGVDAIYGGDYCTFSDAEQFYSYRRDAQTGRQASLIWLD